jgi:hypothetical protein
MAAAAVACRDPDDTAAICRTCTSDSFLNEVLELLRELLRLEHNHHTAFDVPHTAAATHSMQTLIVSYLAIPPV